MVNTPAQALAKARSITKGYGGMCLQFVRLCYGIGAKYPSATAAWNAAQTKHSRSSTADVPLGAPLFFAPNGSPYGHVAIYAGNGLMRTTNSSTNTIQTASVQAWVNAGYRLLGWTEDLNGVKISGLAPPAPPPSPGGGAATPNAGRQLPVLRRGVVSSYVALWQQVLGIKADRSFGPATERATKAWQAARGLAADGSVGPATWEAALQSSGKGYLSRGDTGPQVAIWQTILGINPDGSFGPETEAHTRGFQQHWGITTDASVGPGTSRTWRSRVGTM